VSVTAPAPQRPRPWLAFIQIAVSLAILGGLLAFVDFGALGDRFASADPIYMALGLGLGVAQLVLLGLRWQLLNARLHLASGVGTLSHLAMTGLTHAASQVLPSSIGGDAVRVVALKRLGMTLAASLLSVAADRVAGLMGLLALVLVVLAAGGVPRGGEEAAIASAVAAAISLMLVLAGPWIASRPAIMALARRLGVEPTLIAARTLLRDPVSALGILLLSALPHALNIAMAWCAARALGLTIGWEMLSLAVPLALLVTTLPISVAGWGVREAVLVFVLGLGGVASHDALAVSVTWGALLLALGVLAAGPALLWLARRR
jgi:uncharacterized membrane protein YbhN (UPF0104 family)